MQFAHTVVALRQLCIGWVGRTDKTHTTVSLMNLTWNPCTVGYKYVRHTVHEGLANHSGSIGTENYVLKAQRPEEIMRAPNAMHCQQFKRTVLCVCVHVCIRVCLGGGVDKLASPSNSLAE